MSGWNTGGWAGWGLSSWAGLTAPGGGTGGGFGHSTGPQTTGGWRTGAWRGWKATSWAGMAPSVQPVVFVTRVYPFVGVNLTVGSPGLGAGISPFVD